MSQKQLMNAAIKALGSGSWDVRVQEMQPVFDQSLADLEAGRISPETFNVQVQYCIARPELAHPWDRDDNSLLGVKGIDSAGLGSLIVHINSRLVLA